jgi:hypothetical protein
MKLKTSENEKEIKLIKEIQKIISLLESCPGSNFYLSKVYR